MQGGGLIELSRARVPEIEGRRGHANSFTQAALLCWFSLLLFSPSRGQLTSLLTLYRFVYTPEHDGHHHGPVPSGSRGNKNIVKFI